MVQARTSNKTLGFLGANLSKVTRRCSISQIYLLRNTLRQKDMVLE
jgi:hypothetical protein